MVIELLEKYFPKGSSWPPKGHSDRVTRYTDNKLLFKGQHQDVYKYWIEKLQRDQQDIIYLIINFPGIISKLSADMLFGEFPRFSAGEENSQEQKNLDRLIDSNYLHVANYESALANSYRGDSLYKIRLVDGLGVIEPVPPSIWFPVVDEDNIKESKADILAWTKTLNDKKYLRVEIHEPGYIFNEVWELDHGQIGNQADLSLFYQGMEEAQETGLNRSLIEHIPNFALDDEFFGVDDYSDLDTLFQELNVRVSQISHVLNKHADPGMYGPPDIEDVEEIYNDGTQRKGVRLSNKYIDVPSKDDVIPGYIVWDAQLEAAFKQIDKLIEFLFYVSETSPAAFGIDKSGLAESGSALKRRLLRTLAKINRKKIYYDAGLKNVIKAAMQLEAAKGKGSNVPDNIEIEWKDGLPEDPVENAQVEQIRTGSKATTSVKSAIRRLDGGTDQSIEDELKQIKAEETPPPANPRITLQPGQNPTINPISE